MAPKRKRVIIDVEASLPIDESISRQAKLLSATITTYSFFTPNNP
ncbi:hypothetical protein [Pleurocapsa sp. PCC 7319]|nr:hypothetical protein [Pleurocapsa sp. PCC 7319]